MYAPFCLAYADDFAVLTVYHHQILYCVAFLLPGV
jgi:hypothetical protein